MLLIYSETLYSIYLSSGKLSLFFYAFLSLWAIYNLRAFKSHWVYFLIFIFLSFFSELLTSYGPVAQMENNHFVSHIGLFLDTVLLLLFFRHILNQKLMKKALLIIALIVLILIGFGAIYEDGYLMPPKMLIVKNIVFLFFHLFLQRDLVQNTRQNQLRQTPLFWWNIGGLIINLTYLIFGATINYILPVSDNLAFIWYIVKNAIEPVSCILWMISISYLAKSKKSLKPALT